MRVCVCGDSKLFFFFFVFVFGFGFVFGFCIWLTLRTTTTTKGGGKGIGDDKIIYSSKPITRLGHVFTHRLLRCFSSPHSRFGLPFLLYLQSFYAPMPLSVFTLITVFARAPPLAANMQTQRVLEFLNLLLSRDLLSLSIFLGFF